jgi:dTDP-4-dehydrorhamnose 3,5-epimerase
MIDSEFIVKLEKHDTKDIHDNHTNGELTVIWRDWDNIIKNHPKMIYVSSVNSGEIKGPHIHTKRESYFVCIEGKSVFILKNEDGSYEEIISSDDNPVMVHVPKNMPSAHINLSSKTSRILALADIAWKPNDNEMQNTTFENYDWKKWKKYS